MNIIYVMEKNEIWYQKFWFWILVVQFISFLTLRKSLKIWEFKNNL